MYSMQTSKQQLNLLWVSVVNVTTRLRHHINSKFAIGNWIKAFVEGEDGTHGSNNIMFRTNPCWMHLLQCVLSTKALCCGGCASTVLEIRSHTWNHQLDLRGMAFDHAHTLSWWSVGYRGKWTYYPCVNLKVKTIKLGHEWQCIHVKMPRDHHFVVVIETISLMITLFNVGQVFSNNNG